MDGHMNVKYIWGIYVVWEEKTVFWTMLLSYLESAMNPHFPPNPLPRISIPGNHQPSWDLQDPGIFQHISQIPSPAPTSFEYEIHYSSVYFIIAHSLFVLCPRQPSALIIQIQSGYR